LNSVIIIYVELQHFTNINTKKNVFFTKTHINYKNLSAFVNHKLHFLYIKKATQKWAASNKENNAR